jgi:ATP/maltotriose-dependent transcriptional regulator MalT
MSLMARCRHTACAGIAMAVTVLAGCAGQMEPAQRSISDIEAMVIAASPEAAKYVPDQLTDVQGKLGGLKASFDKKDYSAVLENAPAVMSAAQGLASAAAAKKQELMTALNEQWSGLAAALPGYMTAIQNRIDLLGKKSAKKLAAGVDLDAARASLKDAGSLWSKAQAAFATGNLDEAVTIAQSLKTNLEDLASTLKADLTAPAAAAVFQRANVPSLTMTALPPMCAASKLPCSISSLTLTSPGRFI